jgi:threonine/homoserine/homoserine lactone efflux protein
LTIVISTLCSNRQAFLTNLQNPDLILFILKIVYAFQKSQI